MKDMIRGYDTPQLYRQDTILRLRQLYAEMREGFKRLERIKREVEDDEDPDPDCE